MSHKLQLRVLTDRGTVTLFLDSADMSFRGARTSENERASILFIASYLALLSDSPLTWYAAKPHRLYMSFYKALCTDLKGTVLRLTSLAHQLVSSHLNFGRLTSIGELTHDFKDTPIFREFFTYMRDLESDVSSSDSSLLRYIYTFLNFGKKFEFVDDEFYEVALRDWLDVEERLSGLEFDEVDLKNLRLIISEFLGDRDPFTALPKHGPGNVADRGVTNSPLSKHDAIVFDEKIDRFLFHGLLGRDGLGREDALNRSVVPDPARWQRPSIARRRTPARLLFVPKNLKTARSICEEPATLMYFQQSVMRDMCGAIRRGLFGRYIHLNDQTRNKDLAREGSISSLVDTIDLSAASDSVHINLVKGIFPSFWLIKMLATRSSEASLPDGRIVRLNKFAPMGSAVCFPTQCIIFASVCIYASTLYRLGLQPGDRALLTRGEIHRTKKLISKNAVSYFHPKTHRLNPLAIYGDDIVCDCRVTPHVKSILSRLGFVVNESKSFTDSQSFRESCGGFYLAGSDITPLYFAVEEVRKKLTPNHIASQVAFINRTRSYGYRTLYRLLLRTLMEWEVADDMKPFGIPFRSTGFHGVWNTGDSGV